MQAVDYERIEQLVDRKIRTVFIERDHERTERLFHLFVGMAWMLAGASIATALFVAIKG